MTHLDSGRARTVDCDLVVFTADWVPDHELAVMAGCELDPGTLGPAVDRSMRTEVPGVFATGNLVHPAETADSCALDGRHAAAAVAAHLEGGADWPAEHVRVRGRRAAALGRAEPDRARGARRARAAASCCARGVPARPRLEVSQGEPTLWRGRLARLVPGRSAHIPASWAANVDPAGRTRRRRRIGCDA